MRYKLLKRTIAGLIAVSAVLCNISTHYVSFEYPFPINAYASTVTSCGDNATWKFEESTGTLTISGTGDMENYNFSSFVSPWNTIRDEIKNVVIEDGITSIGEWTFYSCKQLMNISLPASLEHIDKYAFYCCYALESVEIPENVSIIEEYAFYSCHLKSIRIPGSVKSIGDNAFANNMLSEAIISEGVSCIAPLSKKLKFKKQESSVKNNLCCFGLGSESGKK